MGRRKGSNNRPTTISSRENQRSSRIAQIHRSINDKDDGSVEDPIQADEMSHSVHRDNIMQPWEEMPVEDHV